MRQILSLINIKRMGQLLITHSKKNHGTNIYFLQKQSQNKYFSLINVKKTRDKYFSLVNLEERKKTGDRSTCLIHKQIQTFYVNIYKKIIEMYFHYA